MSVDQQAVYLELASLGVRLDVADSMARRQKVRSEVTRRLRLDHARDFSQASHASLQRSTERSGGPAAATAGVMGVAGTGTGSHFSGPATTAGRVAALHSYMKPIILTKGPDRGGAEDIGGTLVRNVERPGKAQGRKIGDAVGAARGPDPGVAVADAVEVVGMAVGLAARYDRGLA